LARLALFLQSLTSFFEMPRKRKNMRQDYLDRGFWIEM